MNIPKAILFDLDDTLLAFSNASRLAWKKCCDEFVKNNKVDFTSELLFERIFKTRAWYWSDPQRNKAGRANMKNARREVFGYALKTFDFTDEQEIYRTADSYTKMQESLWSLFDGIPEALERLRNNNIRMAVVTNGRSDVQRGKLKRFDIEEYFEYVIIDSELGISKPDPGIYRLALKKLSLPAKEVWAIGDNLVWDIKAPQALEIFSVWNDFSGKGLPPNVDITPDMIVQSVGEMVEKTLQVL